MASIIEDKSTGRTYHKLSVKLHGEIKRVSLGRKLPARDKATLLTIVDELEMAYAMNREPEKWALEKLAGMSEDIQNRVAKTGLSQVKEVPKLGAFIDEFVAEHKHGKSAGTVNKWGYVREKLIKKFGADKDLRTFTVADVKSFQRELEKSSNSKETNKSDMSKARQFFGYAVDKEYIPKNPFKFVKIGSSKGSKGVLVSRTEMDAAETGLTGEWQVLFAIYRYTGCRLSEALQLTWGDVLWDADKIRMPSPKTQHHGQGEGYEYRTIPLFPELKPYLERHFDQAPAGTAHVVRTVIDDDQRGGERTANLRKPLSDRLKKIGVEPWKALFQSLRKTRENELLRKGILPHVVHAWIGHSEKTAAEHYLDVSPEDFEAATASLALSQATPTAQKIVGPPRARPLEFLSASDSEDSKPPLSHGLR